MPIPRIQIGEDLLDDAILSSVTVVQQLNAHWWCTAMCRQTGDKRPAVETMLGQDVEIKTVDDLGVETVQFSGFVYSVQLDYEVWGSYGASLVAVSHSYKMDVTRHKQYYAEKTLSDIAGEVTSRCSLSPSVNVANGKALNYVQYGETDFSFLHRIVDDSGAWMRPKAKSLEIFDAFQSGDKLEWRAETGLIDFSIGGAVAPATYSGSHYDHHTMESAVFRQKAKQPQLYDAAQPLTSAVATASQQLPSGFEPQRSRAMTLQNFSDQLEAESERSMGASVNGVGHSRQQNLMAGNTVELTGVLDAKGTYGMFKVVHEWTQTGYSNTFYCTPWKNYRNPEPPATRTWNGVVSARVVDHNDPKKMGRIKVRFFWQEDGSTHWARATSPHAGPDRGFMFLPEVGDEVAIAFEDGDPERPIVLGSVWNGVQNAPRGEFYGSDIPVNDVKRLMTKSGNRMQLVDTKDRETVVLATPKSTSLKMTESYSSTDGRPMIVLHSDGDIVLSAPNGRIHLQSAFFSRQVGE